jgi:hypothetical protein
MTGRQFTVATAAMLLWTAWALTRVIAGLSLVRPAAVRVLDCPGKDEVQCLAIHRAIAFYDDNRMAEVGPLKNAESKENQRP